MSKTCSHVSKSTQKSFCSKKPSNTSRKRTSSALPKDSENWLMPFKSYQRQWKHANLLTAKSNESSTCWAHSKVPDPSYSTLAKTSSSTASQFSQTSSEPSKRIINKNTRTSVIISERLCMQFLWGKVIHLFPSKDWSWPTNTCSFWKECSKACSSRPSWRTSSPVSTTSTQKASYWKRPSDNSFIEILIAWRKPSDWSPNPFKLCPLPWVNARHLQPKSRN